MSEKRVFLETFGCQMNVLDSELVLGSLRRGGWAPTEDRAAADMVLFNTCAVREHAEDKVWSRLGEVRREKRRRPDMIVGVLGCMAQEWKDAILRRAPHVDLVAGTRELSEVARYVAEIERARAPIVAADLTRPVDVERDIAARGERFSAYVTVMRGCDFSCTYCIVPSTRGPEESRPIAELKAEVERLSADGVREITFLGQTVDSYGKGLERLPSGRRPDLGDLMEAVHETPGLARIRFITSHPSLMREPILRRMGELDKVCEYLHMPAQSGSDAVLGRMRRGYTAAKYREIVARARDLVPGIEVASDFIVGFPGETDRDFQATEDLLRELELSQAFIFKYSPRKGTAAAAWDDDVADEVKRERNLRLLAAQEEVARKKHAAAIGQSLEVLCEGVSRNDPRRVAGRTRTNRIVVFEGDPATLEGEVVQVEVTDATPLALYGRLPGRPALFASAKEAIAPRVPEAVTNVPPTAGQGLSHSHDAPEMHAPRGLRPLPIVREG